MANCAKCGAAIADDSAFCGACGQSRAQASAAAPAGGSVSTAPALAVGGSTASSGAPAGTVSAPGLTMNMAAALSYALGAITGVLFLVLEPYKNNRFVRFHAIQSIQLVTEFNYAGSGPLSIVPCSMTHLNFFAQAGADARLFGLKGESPSAKIRETKLTFREPDIDACGQK